MTSRRNPTRWMVALALLAGVVLSPRLLSQAEGETEPDPRAARVEAFFADYLGKELGIANAALRISEDRVLILGTPDLRDRQRAMAQIALSLSGAGVAVPWTQQILFIVQVGGLPIGTVQVATETAVRAAEGKIQSGEFLSTLEVSLLPLPFNFPADLLAPVLQSAPAWREAAVAVCAASELGGLLPPAADSFLLEFLPAACARTEAGAGDKEAQAAVIDFEKEEEARSFLDLYPAEETAPSVSRMGSVVYLIDAPEGLRGPALRALLEPREPHAEEPPPGKELSRDGGKPYEEESERPVPKSERSSRLYAAAGFLLLAVLAFLIYRLSGRSSRP